MTIFKLNEGQSNTLRIVDSIGRVVKDLEITPQSIKYLERGAEMESLIKLVNLQIANLLRFHPNARTLQRFSKELINKLEVNDERA